MKFGATMRGLDEKRGAGIGCLHVSRAQSENVSHHSFLPFSLVRRIGSFQQVSGNHDVPLCGDQ
jgi:hypothetical protein